MTVLKEWNGLTAQWEVILVGGPGPQGTPGPPGADSTVPGPAGPPGPSGADGASGTWWFVGHGPPPPV